MMKSQETIKYAVSTLVSNLVAKDPREWPPQCLALTYQPMRPETNPKEDNDSSEA